MLTSVVINLSSLVITSISSQLGFRVVVGRWYYVTTGRFVQVMNESAVRSKSDFQVSKIDVTGIRGNAILYQ